MELPSISYNNALKLKSHSTVVYHNKQWFDDTYVSRNINPVEENTKTLMDVGKIYTFTYDAKFKDKLDFWDAMPMNFILGHLESKSGNVNAFGMNISYIPPQIRLQVLDKIVHIFDTAIIRRNIEKINEDKRPLKDLPMTYDIAKKILSGSGFEFAIRSYIYNRIKTKPLIVTYQDWWKVATFPSQYILKMNILAIYYLYKKSIRQDYRIGKPEDKLKITKITIKEVKEYLKKKKESA